MTLSIVSGGLFVCLIPTMLSEIGVAGMSRMLGPTADPGLGAKRRRAQPLFAYLYGASAPEAGKRHPGKTVPSLD
ncbi:hypothetical protein PEC302110_12010 [Pectobacterium araliae]|uniref:Uncharacterized protein n=1 Tax=Pectobacterium araliae TaxID=3073862 RepID=A0AAN0K9L7_9GAMM|nr:hypothetical protein PEC302110_12010 [Pectobacterium sp. MAFF 302110]